ncbi:MAG: hypothetical protein R3362_09560, partial [Rhodothermales bacterium]|nr:hypothetical protein [Rhodothermales bacterium]
NRRPVDYALRQRLLDEMAPLLEHPEPAPVRAWTDAHDPRAKAYVTARLLRLRQDRPDLFTGGYRALEVEGDGEAGWVAFAREDEPAGAALLVLVPRYPARWPDAHAASVPLPEEWAGRAWACTLTGTRLEAAAALEPTGLPLPWSVLVGEEAGRNGS